MPIAPASGPITQDVVDSTSAALTDTGIRFPVSAGRMYHCIVRLPYTAPTGVTTTGIAVAVDVPASPTFFVMTLRAPGATTSIEHQVTGTDAAQLTLTATAIPGSGLAVCEFFVQPSVAGEANVQFNTEVNASAITIKKGAYGWWRDCG